MSGDSFDPHSFFAVDLLEAHLHVLFERGRKIFADIIGTDRQLTMTAVDQRRELNARGSTEGADRVHGRTHSAAGEENVIDDDDGATFERKRKIRLAHDWQFAARADIV